MGLVSPFMCYLHTQHISTSLIKTYSMAQMSWCNKIHAMVQQDLVFSILFTFYHCSCPHINTGSKNLC